MNERLKKKVLNTQWRRDGNTHLKYLINSRSLKNIHVVDSTSLMRCIYDLHFKFPCDYSLVELRKWMTTNQKTLYEVFGDK